METKHKIMIALAAIVTLSGAIWAGFGKESGVIDSCTATYETYVKAKYSETYWTTCSSIDANGNASIRPCTTTRYWSNVASPVWVSRTVNGSKSSNAADSYKGNHGFYIHDIPPYDKSFGQMAHFKGFQNYRTAKLQIAVLMMGEYQTFNKETSAYKGCEIMRKQKEPAIIKTWYGNAYDTELMF